MVFFFLWLISLSMIISRSIYVAANGMISFFFMADIPLHVVAVYTSSSAIYTTASEEPPYSQGQG